jgi:predicted ATPase
MLQSYIYNGRKFTFLKSFPGSSNKNTFTLIVGKNGTGKSTLLRSIVIDLLRENVASSTLKTLSDISPYNREVPIGQLSCKHTPTKVICASTSPFDKFPVPRKHQDIAYYSYLGLRGLLSQNLGPAYMARIIFTLIAAARQSDAHANAIATVLDYLDYEPEILTNSAITSPKLVDIILESDDADLRKAIATHFERATITATEANSLMRQLVEIDEKTLRQIRKATMRLAEGSRRGPIETVLGRFGVELLTHRKLLPEDLSLLGRYGLIKLKEVELRKRGINETVKMSDMSSGEQSVVMGLLGIGSQLQDGALICVDEPEVCLHPEWQERYIQLLSHIFSHYRGCHFIIATHSPQIVAQLPDDKCYVMDMEEGVARRSTEFSRKSVDYQLAALFKAPGFKNEYLSRLALNTFIKVAKEKRFDSDANSDYEILDKTYALLHNDDPLREIIESLREMHQTYGRH